MRANTLHRGSAAFVFALSGWFVGIGCAPEPRCEELGTCPSEAVQANDAGTVHDATGAPPAADAAAYCEDAPLPGCENAFVDTRRADAADDASACFDVQTPPADAERFGDDTDGPTQTDGAATIGIGHGRLRDGAYGTTYSVTLTATGGAAPYEWVVTSGTLPPGISLTTAGLLRGTPTEEGDFSFQVTATDGAAVKGSANLKLHIGRKRWLAYLADDATGRALLWLVDTSDPTRKQTLVSQNLPVTGEAQDLYAFSPDGHWLAFVVGGDTPEQGYLHLLDVSGRTLPRSTPMNTDHIASYQSLRWSPGSQYLAYELYDRNDAGAYSWRSAYYVDVSSGVPAEPRAIASVTDLIQWVSDDILFFYGRDSKMGFVRLGSTGFGEPQALPIDGKLTKSLTPFRKAVVEGWSRDCDNFCYLVDFDGPTVVSSQGTSYSADGNWAAVAKRADPTKIDLFGAPHLTTGEPATTLDVGTSACATERVWWANTDATLAWADANGRLWRTTLSSADAQTASIEGAYAGTIHDVVFAPNDQTLGFLAGDPAGDLYLARLGASPTAVRVNTGADAGSTAGAWRYSFSPDGKSIAYFEYRTAPLALAYWVDLRSAAPSPPRLISSSALEISHSLGWSADGMQVAYGGTIGTQPGLFVVDLSNRGDQGVNVTSSPSCSPPDCRGALRSFAFQP